MTILDKIIKEKEKEVMALKSGDVHFAVTSNGKIPTFREGVSGSSRMNVIAEIKRSSPSKGPIQMEVDPVAQAKEYEKSGAAAISVLTDQPFFKGTMDDLRARSEEHTSELQSRGHLVCRLLLEKNNNTTNIAYFSVYAHVA